MPYDPAAHAAPDAGPGVADRSAPRLDAAWPGQPEHPGPVVIRLGRKPACELCRESQPQPHLAVIPTRRGGRVEHHGPKPKRGRSR